VKIGETKRIIEVEPVVEPVPVPTTEPEPAPVRAPEPVRPAR
jgi:hypothetical protein